jgi:predicted nucleotidyltransferase component of viral defense system
MRLDWAEVLAAQEHFGFARPAPIEKDWHVLRATQSLLTLDASPFRFVFAGGTCLARAHRLIRRMSEDVDFKVVHLEDISVSNNALRSQLRLLRQRVVAALQSAGFPIDPSDTSQVRSQDGNRYTVIQLPYTTSNRSVDSPRPTIQIELNYSKLRRPSTSRPLVSFVSEAFHGTPEIPAVDCVSVAESVAEKLVALTRRTGMEVAGLGAPADQALVRHVYDLHVTRDHYDASDVASLAREIMQADAQEFGSQFPAYLSDSLAQTKRALAALKSGAHYAQRYDEFVQLMVYGDKPPYLAALTTIVGLVRRL